MQSQTVISKATKRSRSTVPTFFPSKDPYGPTSLISRWVSPKWVSGERLLLAAILQRAVLDAVMNSDAEQHQTERRRIGAEARRWINSNERAGFTSFINICELLELDPGWVRKKVSRMDPTQIRNRTSETPDAG